ncbi:VanZ family protein [Sporolactobacillus sp. STCC-11]|uniref:VanZ family protein n=1 Tax=Sporolactobacillus caesalpiniae TaxID=3230362 RepID=UPI00339AFAC0
MWNDVTRKRNIVIICFLCYMALLVFVTLFTHNYYTYGRSSNLLIFSSIKLMLRSGSSALIIKNIFGNVLLFLPLGFLLPMIIRSKHGLFWQLLFGFSVSLIIESCQYLFASRIFDIDDIVLNTIGTVIGCLVYVLIHFFKRKLIIFYTH